jgi:hypothetical protein
MENEVLMKRLAQNRGIKVDCGYFYLRQDVSDHFKVHLVTEQQKQENQLYSPSAGEM